MEPCLAYRKQKAQPYELGFLRALSGSPVQMNQVTGAFLF